MSDLRLTLVGMASTGEARRLGRRPALDGLRGVAALVVVIGHSLMTNTRWAENHPTNLGWWLLARTPLRLVTAGDAAVAVFFVLSGYVLARPFLRGSGKSWRIYYPSRLVRLYLPVWGALFLAVLIWTLIPRAAGTGNWWVDAQAAPITMRELFGDATLAAPGSLLNQLWSLRWEVAFSLLLPVYVAVGKVLPRSPIAGGVALAMLTTATWLTGASALMYLSVFGFGVLLAACEPEVARVTSGWASSRWVLVAVVACCGLAMGPYPAQVIAAAALVSAVLFSGDVAGQLSRPSALWLGRVSYSLYLVHIPVVLAIRALAAGPLWLTMLATVAASLLLAAGFHRVVEAPAQRAAARARFSRQAAETSMYATPTVPPA